MKWLLVLVVANLARIGAGGALRCQASGSEGTTACSEDITETAVAATPAEPAALPSGVECAAGSTWKSQCNECVCSPAGYAVCTEMACVEKLEEPILRCAPETRWKHECNTCWCSSQGQAACTLIGCLSFTGTLKPLEVQSAEKKEDEPIDSTISWQQNHYVTVLDTGDDLGKLDLNIGEHDPNLENIYNFKEGNDINTEILSINHYDENSYNTDYLENNTTHDDFSNIEDFGETLPLVDGNDQDVTDVQDTSFSVASDNDHQERHINEVLTRAKRGQNSEKMELDGNQDYDTKTKRVKKPEYAEGNIKKREEKQNGSEKLNDPKHFKDNVYSHSENDQDLNSGTEHSDYESLEHDDKKREAIDISGLMKQDFSKKPLVKRSVCKPNTEFQSNCNSCKCSPDGLSYTCTHNECMEGESNKEVEVFMESEGGVDHIERHSVCKAAATFYIGCNTCHCNYFGNDYSCTNKPCPLPEDVELFHELKAVKKSSTSTNTAQKVVCVANRMFIMDCNTCWCNEDGTSFICTRKVCTIDEDGKKKLNIVEATKKSSKNIAKEIVCVADGVFHIECNKCWCNNDGTDYICTRKGCMSEEPEERGRKENLEQDLRIIKKECTPDEVFEIDCNMCRCNPDGLSYSCTRRACVSQMDEEDRKNNSQIRKARGVTQEPPKACQPGQSFRMDCNTCLCDNEGQDFSCTRNDCNAVAGGTGASATARKKRESTTELIPMECVTDSVFDRDCNVCRCTDGKHAMCTNKRCTLPQTETHEDVTPLPNINPDFRCNPGEQFKRGCNDCSCSADGKSVFCTVRFCDQDIAPVPST